MKLKKLLSESKAWNERKFGEPLPTLEDTTKAYKLKKEQEVKEPVKEDIKDFNRRIDSEGLHKIVRGRDGVMMDARRKVSDIHKLTRDTNKAVLADLTKDYATPKDKYKSHRKEWRTLHKEIDEAAENLFDSLVDLVDLSKRHYKWVESVKKVEK